MPVTLKDIADRAGVSSAAVSMALNNKKGVSCEKARQIRRIAADLGYAKLPRLDVSGYTVDFIQIVKPSRTWDDSYKVFIAEYLQGLTTEAGKRNLTIEVKTFTTEHPASVQHELRGSSTLGTVLLGAGLYPQEIRAFEHTSAGTVFIDVCYPSVAVDCIDMDNASCVYRVVEYLKERGHTRIGIVQADHWTPNFAAREAAFYAALHDFGVEWCKSTGYFRSNRDQNVGKDQLIKQLRARSERPSALFCVNDTIAYNCIHACQELAIAIPDDIAIVGFDDLPASKIMRPRLTTVGVPREWIAKRALRTLLDRISAPAYKPPERILVGGRLIERESA